MMKAMKLKVKKTYTLLNLDDNIIAVSAEELAEIMLNLQECGYHVESARKYGVADFMVVYDW